MERNILLRLLVYFCQTSFRMRNTLKIGILLTISCFTLPVLGQKVVSQADKESLEKEFDAVAQEWHDIAAQIDNYEGLAEYCTNPDFEQRVVVSIRKIHHFDSLIMDRLKDPSFIHDNEREERKTLKNIEEFESEYRLPNFMSHLKSECDARHDIEKNRKNTVNELGSESYSGQVYLVELELYKYIHHIDKRLKHIEKHLHKIHIDDVTGS